MDIMSKLHTYDKNGYIIKCPRCGSESWRVNVTYLRTIPGTENKETKFVNCLRCGEYYEIALPDAQ